MAWLRSRCCAAFAIGTVTISLTGCGGGGGPGPGPTPAPSPGSPTPSPSSPSSPTPSPTPAPTTNNYGPAPDFYLEDKRVHGFSYSPDYLAKQSCLTGAGGADCTKLNDDDFYADWGDNIWSNNGRGDIEYMKAFGANSVRLYGNDPRFSKQKFLDSMQAAGMKVIAGVSNYIYKQSPQPCLTAGGGDCFKAMKEHYVAILNVGEFAKNNYYHRALDIISMANELEQRGGGGLPLIKGVVSAFDALLSAEKQVGIKAWPDGRLPKISVTWSLAYTGGDCVSLMVKTFNAMKNPQSVGYTPDNSDILDHFQKRWINSFNGFTTGDQMLGFVSRMKQEMPGFKAYIGEWTREPRTDISPGGTKEQLTTDLHNMVTADGLIGVCYYAFTQPYDQLGFDKEFGVYKLTSSHPWNTSYITGDSEPSHPINCLAIKDQMAAEVIAAEYGGKVPQVSCPTQGDSAALVVV